MGYKSKIDGNPLTPYSLTELGFDLDKLQSDEFTDTTSFNSVISKLEVINELEGIDRELEYKISLFGDFGFQFHINGVLEGSTNMGEWNTISDTIINFNNYKITIKFTTPTAITVSGILNNGFFWGVNTVYDKVIKSENILQPVLTSFSESFILPQNIYSPIYEVKKGLKYNVIINGDSGNIWVHFYDSNFQSIEDNISIGNPASVLNFDYIASQDGYFVIFTNSVDLDINFNADSADSETIINIESRNKNIKLACLGDSLTSNQVSNIGRKIKENINATYLRELNPDDSPINSGNVTIEFGNLACGGATLTDVYLTEGVNSSFIQLEKSENLPVSTNPENVLSNQVLRLLQHTTALGQQIQWTHPIDLTNHNVPTLDGLGKGYVNDVPDIIYIASGVNDLLLVGEDSIVLRDDYSAVIAESYSTLKKDSLNSALRWAIETLQINYPNASIFVTTMLYTPVNQNIYEVGFRGYEKINMIKAMVDNMGVKLIDSYFNSGINKITYKLLGDNIHPNNDGQVKSASFAAADILSKFSLNKRNV